MVCDSATVAWEESLVSATSTMLWPCTRPDPPACMAIKSSQARISQKYETDGQVHEGLALYAAPGACCSSIDAPLLLLGPIAVSLLQVSLGLLSPEGHSRADRLLGASADGKMTDTGDSGTLQLCLSASAGLLAWC